MDVKNIEGVFSHLRQTGRLRMEINMGMIRLDKYLADMQAGTRSQVKEYIRKRRVCVDDMVVTAPEYKIDAATQKVTLDNKTVGYVEYEYYMLNKPMGVVSATSDKNDKTVVDLIDSSRKDLFPVGRLDKDTEGLLILTNDGKLAHELLSPKKHVGKTYFALIEGEVNQQTVELFKNGLVVDKDFTAMPAVLEILGKPVCSAGVTAENMTGVYITIHEGKFHQIKRMFAAVGCEVKYLQRVQMGALVLDRSLQQGEYRPLTEEEINYLKEVNCHE